MRGTDRAASRDVRAAAGGEVTRTWLLIALGWLQPLLCWPQEEWEEQRQTGQGAR